MTRVTLIAITSVLAAVGLLAQSATAPLMNVKMGLWESTATTQMTMMGKPVPAQPARVTKVCMTAQKLASGGFDAPDPKSGMQCTRKVTAQTATSTDTEMSCTNDKLPGQKMMGTGHYEVLSPESVKGKSTITMTGQAAMTIDLAMDMKYVGPDCGDIK